MTSKSSQMKKWEEKRKQGKIKFIMTTGVICWGVTTGILWSLAMFFIDQNPKTLKLFISFFIPGIIGFPIGGYFWGLIMWNLTEKKYQRYIKDHRNKDI